MKIYKATDFLSGQAIRCDGCKKKTPIKEFSIHALKQHHGKTCKDCGHGPLINNGDIVLARIVLAFAWVQAALSTVGLVNGEKKKLMRITSAPDIEEKAKIV